MEYLTRPLNITRQVTLLTTGAIFAAGLVAYVVAGLAGGSTPPLIFFAMSLAAASVIGALIVGLIVRSKQRDLWLLAIAARKMGEGDLSTPIRTNGKVEEVFFLAKVLEQNRIRIQAMVRELAAAKEWSDSQRSVQAYFLANISHEFRTPLAGMKVSLELLLDNLRDLSPSELDELLNSLHLSVSSMSQLIDNLLESSKIEAEQLTLRPVNTDAERLIVDSARLAQPFLNRRGQRLSIDIPLTPTRVQADTTRLIQVLVNLLINASKYSPAGGVIDVAVDRDEAGTRVTIADRGAGIPADKRDGVFKRFVRLGATASEDYGAGLGLSVVKAIIQAHGGTVGVDAREGGGSKFWFTLPAA
jgi:signal transduction histidine kinase